MSAYGQNQIPGYFDRLNSRKANVPLGEEELKGTLGEVDACISEFTSHIESILSAVWEYAHATVATLKQLRADFERDINLAIEEVKMTMDQDNPQLQHEFSSALRNFEPNSYSLKLFTYKLDKSPFPTSLDQVLWFSHGLVVGERYLPVWTYESLILHDLLDGQTRTIPFQNNPMGSDPPICILNSQTVICLPQDNSPDGTVISLDLSTARFTQLQSMSTGRFAPGVLKHKDFIYVFGGSNQGQHESLRSCEKFNLLTRSWTTLLNMHSGKAFFTPCFYDNKIYLPCVFHPTNRDSPSVLEAFNVNTEEFKALSITLPSFSATSNTLEVSFQGLAVPCPSGASGASLSFIVDGQLMILTSSQIGRCRLEKKKKFEVSNVEGSGSSIEGSVVPVHIGRKVYWASRGSLWHFDLKTITIANTI